MIDLKHLLVFWGALIVAIPSVDAADRKPNILLIMADDVGCDAIGCYGGQSYPTPHIDALASKGMKFTHGYSMPVCHPSRICMMTGRYPFRYGKQGLKWGDYPQAAEGESIGNRMKQAGYTTAVAGKWQLCTMKEDPGQPRRVGFDEWCLFGWHEGARYNDPLIYQNGKVREGTSGQYGPDFYVDFLVNFMERSQDSEKPFFAYYPMALCHDVTDDLKDQHVAYYKDGRWMTFGEMVASMDDMVGRLTQALDRMGIRDETLIIFTTDNGTPAASYLNVNENGKMVRPKVFSIRNGKIVPGGKGKHDDTGTRVPLIANWPGHIKAGSVVNEMVDLTDYLPTVCELAGLKDDGVARDGISFAPILFGQKRNRKREWVYCEHNKKHSIRSADFRLYDNGSFFDLKNDPTEKARVKVDQLQGDALRNYQSLKSVLEQMQNAR